MLTSKQRAYLRGLANPLDTILMVGKGGVTGDVIQQADQALTARELIKCKCWKPRPIPQGIPRLRWRRRQAPKWCRSLGPSLFYTGRIQRIPHSPSQSRPEYLTHAEGAIV